DVRIIFVDGLHFRDHVVLLALGVDAQGQKHVIALREGTTENATVCKGLLADLRDRGLDLDRAVLFVIDGGTGLRKALRETCGPSAIVQRCQVHKRRNVLDHLPEAMRPRVRRCSTKSTASRTPRSPRAASCSSRRDSIAPTPAPRRPCAKGWT